MTWSLLVLFKAFSSAREDQDRLERQEHQNWELANVKLQQKTILQTDETQNKQEEKKSEEEMVEDMFRFLPKSTERQEVLSKSVTRVRPQVNQEQGNMCKNDNVINHIILFWILVASRSQLNLKALASSSSVWW